MEMAVEIHSNPQLSPRKKRKAALKGLFHTLVTNGKQEELINMSKGSQTLSKKVIPYVVNHSVQEFEKSDDNLIRSVMTLYRGGLISKVKYNNIRSSLIYKPSNKSITKVRAKLGNDVLIPKLVGYKDLMKFIKSIDIGELKPIPQVQSEADEDCNPHPSATSGSKISGCFIDLEYRLLQVARMYLDLNQQISILSWFRNPPGSFLVALGADGAPFGKENEATAWLISFLNVGNRIASCEENFLILGANCKEDHPAMIKYGEQLKNEISLIESKTYSIEGHENLPIKFSFELVPSDMKWLAKFSGELSNSATFPSSFANVRLDELTNVKGSFSTSPTSTWKPWSYDQRCQVAKEVTKYKNKTVVKRPVKQQRTLVTKFIASKCSRQEFEPILGHVIDKAACEPLHLGNNCWQQWNKEIMMIALSRSNISAGVVNVYLLPFECCFRRYLRAVRNKVKSRKLYKKIVRWFHENRDSEFQCRFTGEETRKFCNNFMDVVDAITVASDTDDKNLPLYALAYAGLKLRNATSLMNRITDIDQQAITDLQKHCSEYFICSALFKKITLSMWTVGFCVPFHSLSLFEKFGVGLGINTMQGREAKHQKLATYSKFSLPRDRWEKVFLHEHMCLIWLRKHNPHNVKYCKSKVTYIPSRCYLDTFCFCGFPKSPEKSGCSYCSSPLMVDIAASVAAKQISSNLLHILAH